MHPNRCSAILHDPHGEGLCGDAVFRRGPARSLDMVGRLSAGLAGILTMLCLGWTPAVHAAGSSSTIESQAVELFKGGDYAAVTALYRTLPAHTPASKPFLRLSLLSFIRL